VSFAWHPSVDRITDLIGENDAFYGVRRYQGAFTKAFVSGVFFADPENDIYIWHDDVKSMYPMSMVVLNLSSENMVFISKKPFTGEYSFDYDKGLVEVPDEYIGQLVVKVGREDSVTRNFMLKFFAIRQKLREGGQTLATKSHQEGIKLIMNATYGYHGLEFSRYGSFLVAIVTTAVGRLIMKEIIGIIDLDEHKNCTKLECDTDGMYHYGTDLSDEINARVHDTVADYPLHKMLHVETQRYAGMIVYRAKNYVLKTLDGKLKFKGSAFKGRHMPPICRTALHRFAHAIFDKKPLRPIWREFHDLRSFPLREFTMSVTLRKDPQGGEYGYDEGTMYSDLSKKLGKDVVWGQDVYYVKTKFAYEPIGYKKDSVLLKTLDRDYYNHRIRDVVKRLEYAANKRKTIKVGRKKLIVSGKTSLAEFMEWNPK